MLGTLSCWWWGRCCGQRRYPLLGRHGPQQIPRGTRHSVTGYLFLTNPLLSAWVQYPSAARLQYHKSRAGRSLFNPCLMGDAPPCLFPPRCDPGGSRSRALQGNQSTRADEERHGEGTISRQSRMGCGHQLWPSKCDELSSFTRMVSGSFFRDNARPVRPDSRPPTQWTGMLSRPLKSNRAMANSHPPVL